GLAKVMGIAGRHKRQPQLVCNGDGALGALTLYVQAVILYLDIEVVAEDSGKPLGEPRRFFELVFENKFTELAGGASAQADQAVLMRGQKLLVDPRNVVVAVQKGDRCHFNEIAEPG